jgi:hypothetical protein
VANAIRPYGMELPDRAAAKPYRMLQTLTALCRTPLVRDEPAPISTAWMPEYDVYCGLDVGKEAHHAVALDRNGKRLHDAAQDILAALDEQTVVVPRRDSSRSRAAPTGRVPA